MPFRVHISTENTDDVRDYPTARLAFEAAAIEGAKEGTTAIVTDLDTNETFDHDKVRDIVARVQFGEGNA